MSTTRISGQTPDGGQRPISVDFNGRMTTVATSYAPTAFGELIVAENTPIAQHALIYGPQSQIENVIEQAGGSVSEVTRMLECSSGSNANGLAAMTSKRPIKIDGVWIWLEFYLVQQKRGIRSKHLAQ